ncbi:hypothetical protein [Paenibacillus oleatilyticus]|uniref:DUF98 domain-containing protein n=1 Tax=Paenibacillus oleatilyticus TaxID=2594886 RepID=A0ABV4UX64_9BACL
MTTDLPNDTASRMLLRSDGSTTLLMESMLGTELGVRVIGQQTVRGESIDGSICDLLEAKPETVLFERYSELETPNGQWVSRNYVVARIDGMELFLGQLQNHKIPLGKLLMSFNLAAYRKLLGYGAEERPLNGQMVRLPYKHYVICGETGPKIYIREAFNPIYVTFPGNSDPACGS